MSSLLHNRRGSVAFATVVALVPLIGVIALGAEGGSWYVTRQHAQNAADAAAYSGALRLACGLGAIACTDTESVDYRGKQFAAQNSFCNTGDTSYPGSRCTSLATDVAQSVEINQLGTWKGVSGNFVQAVISQQQPAYLAKLLGLSTVNIGAIAVAEVQNPKELCALGLGRYPQNSSALILGGSVDITGNGCGLMSNDTVKYASTPTFSGSGWAVEAVGGCVNSGNCDPGVPYNYYMPAATNPLEQLDSASFNDVTGNAKPCRNGSVTNNDPPCTLSPLSTGAYGDLTVTGSSVTFNAGTYFFYNAKIKINGGTVTGTDVTLVLLGNSSISITGGTVSLSAPAINTTYPALSGVLIDDQAPNKSNNAVNINGGGAVALGGAMYFPNVDVTWNGTTANTNTTCSQVIANSLTMGGGAYMSTSGCVPSTIAQTQVVALVQ